MKRRDSFQRRAYAASRMVAAVERQILSVTAADKDKARIWVKAWRSVSDIHKPRASTRAIERYRVG